MRRKRLKCTLLNGSAWSTEKKYTRRYKGTFDTFIGTEHRLRKDEMEKQLKKEAKEEWRFAADAARITDESTIDPFFALFPPTSFSVLHLFLLSFSSCSSTSFPFAPLAVFINCPWVLTLAVSF